MLIDKDETYQGIEQQAEMILNTSIDHLLSQPDYDMGSHSQRNPHVKVDPKKYAQQEIIQKAEYPLIRIRAAFYGPIEVHQKILNNYQYGFKTFYADNKMFGDPVPHTIKRLTIFWDY